MINKFTALQSEACLAAGEAQQKENVQFPNAKEVSKKRCPALWLAPLSLSVPPLKGPTIPHLPSAGTFDKVIVLTW